jgi:hypothetical protein
MTDTGIGRAGAGAGAGASAAGGETGGGWKKKIEGLGS